MRVLVLGAGIAGVTTAWALVKDGADVTVVDRCTGPAQETSRANGGHVSVGQSRPWSSPDAPRHLLCRRGKDVSPFRLRLGWEPTNCYWGLSFLRNCRRARYSGNARTLIQLARFSREELKTLISSYGGSFTLSNSGLLAVVRDSYELDRLAREAILLSSGEEFLDADSCAEREPALSDAVTAGAIAGGLFASDGASGDAYSFTTSLAKRCVAAGVRFRYGNPAKALTTVSNRITGARTIDGDIVANAVVLAAGQESRTLAATVGIRLPLLPVKGASITVPATPPAALPTLGILDENARVVISRFGNTVRAAGTADFGVRDPKVDRERALGILNFLASMFPAAQLPTSIADAQPWAGIRAMTPDGPPILGSVPNRPGLFLNTGHGSLGWTLAAGAARITADAIAGKKLAIDLTGLSVTRFG